MNTKLFALIAIAALTVTLITTATTSNAFAGHRHHNHGSSNSQSLAQSNSCGGNSDCSNIGSQIQGNRNSVSISSSQ